MCARTPFFLFFPFSSLCRDRDRDRDRGRGGGGVRDDRDRDGDRGGRSGDRDSDEQAYQPMGGGSALIFRELQVRDMRGMMLGWDEGMEYRM